MQQFPFLLAHITGNLIAIDREDHWLQVHILLCHVISVNKKGHIDEGVTRDKHGKENVGALHEIKDAELCARKCREKPRER
jgi:hypothetical protein